MWQLDHEEASTVLRNKYATKHLLFPAITSDLYNLRRGRGSTSHPPHPTYTPEDVNRSNLESCLLVIAGALLQDANYYVIVEETPGLHGALAPLAPRLAVEPLLRFHTRVRSGLVSLSYTVPSTPSSTNLPHKEQGTKSVVPVPGRSEVSSQRQQWGLVKGPPYTVWKETPHSFLGGHYN